jgi:hypothetical protein
MDKIKHSMKPLILIITVVSLISGPGLLAQESVREVKPFSRIIASPHINVILEKGESESVRLVSNNIDPTKINIEVKGKTLHLYLDKARVTDKLERYDRNSKRSLYEGATVTAYVTYRDLERLEVRGAQEVTCLSPIHSDKKFKLKAYGENEINLVSLQTDYFKTVLYGENKLKIKGGKADYQRYKLYGENRVETSRMKSYSTSATSFGDSDVRVQSDDEVRVTAFGETRVSYTGDAYVSKGVIIGNTDISRKN